MLVNVAPVAISDEAFTKSDAFDTSIPPNPFPATFTVPCNVTVEPFTRIPPLPFVAVTLFSVAVVLFTFSTF